MLRCLFKRMNYLATTLCVFGVAPLMFGAASGAFLPPDEMSTETESAAAAVDSLPLPALKTFIEKVVEKARREDENDRGFQQRYAYKRTKTTEERDAEGKLEKRQQRASQHTPNPDLIRATRAPRPSPQPGAAAPKRPLDKKDFSLDQELLDHFQVQIAGREILNDRPTILLDFKPADRTLPVKSLKDHFLNRVAGRLWVDESEFVLVRTDVHLTHTVSIVGGLVGSVKALLYHFDRERTPEGFWFTRKVKWHVEARELLANKKIDYSEESLDVKRVE